MRMLKIRPYEKKFNPTIKIKIGIYPFKHAYFNNEKEPRKKTFLLANLGLFRWAKVKLFDIKRINRK